jgi:WD40 repeat protein
MSHAYTSADYSKEKILGAKKPWTRRLVKRSGVVQAVAMSPDMLVTGGVDGIIIVYETTEWAETARIEREGAREVKYMRFSADYEALVIVSKRKVSILNTSDWSSVIDITVNSWVNQACFSPDRQFFAIASNDNCCTVYNNKFEEIHSIAQWEWVQPVVEEIKWDFDTGQVEYHEIDDEARAHEAKVAVMLAKAAAAQASSNGMESDAESEEEEDEGHAQGAVYSVDFGHESDLMAFGGTDNSKSSRGLVTLMRLNTTSHRNPPYWQVECAVERAHRVTTLSFLPKFYKLASEGYVARTIFAVGGQFDKVSIYEVTRDEVVGSICTEFAAVHAPYPVRQLQFSPDAKLMGVVGDARSATIFTTVGWREDQQIRHGGANKSSALAFSVGNTTKENVYIAMVGRGACGNGVMEVDKIRKTGLKSRITQQLIKRKALGISLSALAKAGESGSGGAAGGLGAFGGLFAAAKHNSKPPG